MKTNFNEMTMEELKELQELLSTEIDKREKEKRDNARKKIRELLYEVENICADNNFNLYVNDYDEPYKIIASDIYVD